MCKDELRESEVEFAASLKRAFFHVLLSHMFSSVTLDKQVNMSFSFVNNSNNIEVLLSYQ